MKNPLYENILIETRSKQREDYQNLESQETQMKRRENRLSESNQNLTQTNEELVKELIKLKKDLHYHAQFDNDNNMNTKNTTFSNDFKAEETVQVEFE